MKSAAKMLILSLVEKASALCFSSIRSHGVDDGNKRITHAAMEVFLVLNGMEITASVDDQERVMFALAAGEVSRAQLVEWLGKNVSSLISTR
jgi:death-on-curing protein